MKDFFNKDQEGQAKKQVKVRLPKNATRIAQKITEYLAAKNR
jgi:hypothetical protein